MVTVEIKACSLWQSVCLVSASAPTAGPTPIYTHSRSRTHASAQLSSPQHITLSYFLSRFPSLTSSPFYFMFCVFLPFFFFFCLYFLPSFNSLLSHTRTPAGNEVTQRLSLFVCPSHCLLHHCRSLFPMTVLL